MVEDSGAELAPNKDQSTKRVGVVVTERAGGGSLTQLYFNTGNDGYSGDRYSGNDGYSGLNPPDDAILFTVSGITAIADKKWRF